MTLALVPGYEGGEPGQPVSRETVAVIADICPASPTRCRRTGPSTSRSPTPTPRWPRQPSSAARSSTPRPTARASAISEFAQVAESLGISAESKPVTG